MKELINKIKRNKIIKIVDKKDEVSKHIPLRKFSKGGKISTVMAIVSFLMVAVAIGIGIAMKGQAGIYVGVIVFFALIISAVGFVVGIKSFEEENKFMMYTYIGTIFNSVIWLFILGIYLVCV